MNLHNQQSVPHASRASVALHRCGHAASGPAGAPGFVEAGLRATGESAAKSAVARTVGASSPALATVSPRDEVLA